jgi:transmembrane 9 superfamily protein 3
MKGYLQILFFGFLVLLKCIEADDSHTKPFKEGEEVIVWVNKVGPFRNPQETYMYYSLPFCKPEKDTETHMEGLGEALQGYELRKSPILIEFKRDGPKRLICKKTINQEEAEEFIHAVKNQYWYQLFIDDLPVWGMVGELVTEGYEQRPYIYTHMKFSLSFNKDRVIEVNLTAENPVALARGVQLDFSYSVTWVETDIPFEKRFQKYLDNNFFEHQIHWFSIFNSFMMVIFLTGLVAMILMRTLHKDIARYTKDDEGGERDVGDESGWKQVHGDVFRSPPHLILFSSLIGTGHQLAILVLVVILLANFTTWYSTRGTTITVFIFLYALSSFIGGYAGGGYYARNEGKNWIRCMLFTATLFPGVVVSIAFLLNFIAIAYGSLAAIPFGTMVVVTLIWCFISFPMTLIGTVIGRNWNGTADNPCRISPVPHPIPEKPWYLHPLVNILLGGILPFGSIFIEMYFIFTSFWHYKYYYVYGFMLLVYLILVIVSVCVTIVSTYFLLNSEDYRWQWISFLSSASIAGYVFLYSIYYFFMKTKMSGFFQTCFYFGYVAMFCIGLGILCGAIGFIGTSIFVKKIYQNVKID